MGLLSLFGAALYYHPWVVLTLTGVIITLVGVVLKRRKPSGRRRA